MAGPQFTPDLVYNLIANNPQGRVFVENLAKMSQLQQAAQQFAPQVNQFAQNPMQAMQNIGNWAAGAVNQMEQQQPQQANGQQYQQAPVTQPEQTQPQGGNPMFGNPMGMAMEIVGEFKTALKEMGETLTTIKDTNAALTEQVATLGLDLASARDEIGKLTETLK